MFTLKGYAIYNPATGLYSRGGWRDGGPKWSKNPKIWSDIGPLKNHLNMIIVGEDYRNYEFVIRNYYRGCVILDVTTMQPATEIDAYQYAIEFVNKKKAESKYRADWNVRME